MLHDSQAAGSLRVVALRFERGDDPLTMVALDFDDAVLDGSAGSAGGAQMLAEHG